MLEVISAPVPGLDLRREYGHHQSPAIRVAGLIFCSGMMAINPETGEREHGTVTSETRLIFENLKLLLESAGSSLDRIVQVHAMIYDRIARVEAIYILTPSLAAPRGAAYGAASPVTHGARAKGTAFLSSASRQSTAASQSRDCAKCTDH
jgi:2-iminobutanoate/2-iminopropanoate deaminase